jgi:type II secretory pathway pseudopilin PulG
MGPFMPKSPPSAKLDVSEQGFGMIEISVSMVLLFVLSLAFLPLLAQAALASAQNASTALALQLASSQIEEVRAAGGSCDKIKKSAILPPVRDDRGSSLVASRSLEWLVSVTDGCPSSYPATVRVTASVVSDAQPTVNMAALVTIVYVEGP